MRPSKEIRAFDGRDYIGKFATIECQHTDVDVNEKKKIPTDQYISFVLGDSYKDGHHIGGWAGKVLGKKGELIKKKIKNVTLIEAINGGRSNLDEHQSYKEFFD